MTNGTWADLVTWAVYGLSTLKPTIPVSEADAPIGTRVTIDSGVIEGLTGQFTTADGAPRVNEYLGIPFGRIPRRFDRAETPRKWSGVLDATDYRTTCLQQFSYPEDARERTIRFFDTPAPPTDEGEDCLHLNVYAPADAQPGSKAVIFWLYGGSFKFGSAALPLYTGAGIAAQQDVIVVTANYRTNVFGFPGSTDIPLDQRNLAFYDQRLALDWVQRNIGVMGGDPNRVTIVGESAGAGSVDSLVTLPPDPIPFSAAIMESGQNSVYIDKKDSVKSWAELVTRVGCDRAFNELDCMRKVPATDLLEAEEKAQLTFWPVPDDVTWAKRARINRLQSRDGNSKIARVPILIGSNADEGTLLQYGKSPEEQKKYGLLAFQCPAAVVADESHAVGIPTWRYYFNASFPNTQFFEGAGAYHSSEISLIFGTFPIKGTTPGQRVLSAKMQKAWADFAKNPTAGPGWDQQPALGIIDGASATIQSVKDRSRIDAIDKGCAANKLLYDLISLLQ